MMHDEPVHVLFCANSRYFRHMGVALASLADHSKGCRVTAHVMTSDRNAAEVEKLRRTLDAWPDVTLAIYDVEPSSLEGLFVDRYFTLDTYMRLLAPRILPHSIDRLIYLDSDLLVLDDIRGLWRTNLHGKAFGAALDVDVWNVAQRRFDSIGLRPEDPYINAGVLLIDLVRWRAEGISDRLLSFAAAMGARLEAHDQDALNVVLKDDVALLDARWNLQVISYSRKARIEQRTHYRATAAARERPGILHYTSGEKPWVFRSSCRRKALYYAYLDKTAWRAERPDLDGAWQDLEYLAARHLLKWGVDVHLVSHAARRVGEELRRKMVSPPPPVLAPASALGEVGSPTGRRHDR